MMLLEALIMSIMGLGFAKKSGTYQLRLPFFSASFNIIGLTTLHYYAYQTTSLHAFMVYACFVSIGYSWGKLVHASIMNPASWNQIKLSTGAFLTTMTATIYFNNHLNLLLTTNHISNEVTSKLFLIGATFLWFTIIGLKSVSSQENKLRDDDLIIHPKEEETSYNTQQ